MRFSTGEEFDKIQIIQIHPSRFIPVIFVIIYISNQAICHLLYRLDYSLQSCWQDDFVCFQTGSGDVVGSLLGVWTLDTEKVKKTYKNLR